VYARTDFVLSRLIRVSLKTAAYTAVISIAGAAVSSALEGGKYSTSAFAFYRASFLFASLPACLSSLIFLSTVPLPALHAVSLMTTVSSKRTVAAKLSHYDDEMSKAASPRAANLDLPPARTFRLGALSFPRSARGGESGEFGSGLAGVQVKRVEEVRYEDDVDEDILAGRRAREVAIDVV
jgi:hypothetical protein